jgi:hypothetical protein
MAIFKPYTWFGKVETWLNKTGIVKVAKTIFIASEAAMAVIGVGALAGLTAGAVAGGVINKDVVAKAIKGTGKAATNTAVNTVIKGIQEQAVSQTGKELPVDMTGFVPDKPTDILTWAKENILIVLGVLGFVGVVVWFITGKKYGNKIGRRK